MPFRFSCTFCLWARHQVAACPPELPFSLRTVHFLKTGIPTVLPEPASWPDPPVTARRFAVLSVQVFRGSYAYLLR